MFIEQSLVCNFADDMSLYACGATIDMVVLKLEHDMNNALTWFDNNSLVPNPDKFQFMILGTRSKPYLCLEINDKKIISNTKITLLGILIDWKLQFNEHVKSLCIKANNKVSAMMRLRNLLSTEQKLVLFNSFVSSQFGYCPLIWMFHGKSANDIIDRVHRRALRAVYNDFQSDYDSLLAMGNHQRIHQLNLKKLILKIYKCLNNEAPCILSGIFTAKNNCVHDLRINNLLQLPAKCSTRTYGLHSFKYRGSATWNTLSDNFKKCEKSSILKNLLKTASINCSCKMCIVT